jgi:hypothetical protein
MSMPNGGREGSGHEPPAALTQITPMQTTPKWAGAFHEDLDRIKCRRVIPAALYKVTPNWAVLF